MKNAFKQSIWSAAICAGLILSCVPAQATPNFLAQKPVKYSLGVIAAGMLFTSVFIQPEQNFKPRYSMKKLAEVNKIGTKEYWDNAYYVIRDGFLGQKGKDAVKIKFYEDKKKLAEVEGHVEYPVVGFCGHLVTYLGALDKAVAGLAVLAAMDHHVFKISNFYDRATNGRFGTEPDNPTKPTQTT
jgi:hypothetical protein